VIFVDTSVWVDHLRVGDVILAGLLETSRVLVHPLVVGGLALGNLRQRQVILGHLRDLPQVEVATNGEVLQFIQRHDLAGLGIGYVDVHVLASAQLTSGSSLWTRDNRLSAVAEQLGLANKLPT
jgi:predicted nucleic acid-binding protein